MSKGSIPSIRCPKHNERFLINTMEKMGDPLGAFIKRHNCCGKLELYDGEVLAEYVLPPGSKQN
jgi:hypothetical protein